MSAVRSATQPCYGCKMNTKKKASGCAIAGTFFLTIICFLFWLYWNPWILKEPIRVSGQILHSELNEPAPNAFIVFREYGWRGLPIPNGSGGSLHDRRMLTVRADANGRFSTSFRDDWIEVSEIKVDGDIMPDFDVLFTNRTITNASLHRKYFRLGRAAYPDDPEIIVHVYREARPVPKKKWKWTHEFIPRDRLGQ